LSSVPQQQFTSGFPAEFSRKHGCAWVVWNKNKPRSPLDTPGWASIGGEPAFEFQRLSDLPKDVVWWTNLSKSESWAVGRLANIKHAGFLGPDWNSLMSEWGFPDNLDKLKKDCSAWSEIFARIGEWLSRLSSSPNSPPWSWGDGEFHESLADRLGLTELDNDNSHPALSAAFCDQVDMDIMPNTLTGKRKITLSLPRSRHAHDILLSRFPAGKFEPVPNAEIPGRDDEKWNWIKSQKDPILLCFEEVLWRQGYHDEASLWWGLRGRRFAAAAMEPVWLTGEDALDMMEFIDAAPTSVLRCDAGWTTLKIPEQFKFSSHGWLSDNSIVSGILLEGLWRAAATPVRTPTKRIKSPVTPRDVWWRSVDRRIMFRHALELQKQNLTIASYGQGTVTVVFSNENQPDWNSVIRNSNFKIPVSITPMLNIGDGPDLTSRHADIWIKSMNNMEPWLWIDRLTHPWIGSKKNVLKPILELSLRSLSEIKLPSDKWAEQWKNDIRAQAKESVQSLSSSKS